MNVASLLGTLGGLALLANAASHSLPFSAALVLLSLSPHSRLSSTSVGRQSTAPPPTPSLARWKDGSAM